MAVRAKRTDTAHRTILSELRQAGFAVADTSSLGGGFPDAVISRNFLTALLEIKSKRGRKTAQERLREAQKDFHSTWKGPIIVAFTTADVLFDWRLLTKRVGL